MAEFVEEIVKSIGHQEVPEVMVQPCDFANCWRRDYEERPDLVHQAARRH